MRGEKDRARPRVLVGATVVGGGFAMRSISRRFFSFLAGMVLACGVLGFDEARAYSIFYKYSVNATDGPGTLSSEGVLYGQPELYDEQTVQGNPDADNYATLKYFADLPAGALGSYTYSQGGVTDFYPFGFEAYARVDQISFAVRLNFTVAAGEYPAGVDVGISGSADGGLWAEIDSGAQLQYAMTFGYAEIRTPLMQIGTYESGSIEIHEPFALVTRIVSPGTVLSQPQVFPVTLSAWILSNWTYAVMSGTPPDYHTGAAEADLYSALRFTHVTVPAGVTWDSEDHVFLSDVTAVHENTTPRTLSLKQNVPNPFNPCTTIRFDLPAGGRVRLAVYDVAGRLIRVLAEGERSAGSHEAVWDGRDAAGRAMASGSYFARLSVDGKVETVRMGLVR